MDAQLRSHWSFSHAQHQHQCLPWSLVLLHSQISPPKKLPSCPSSHLPFFQMSPTLSFYNSEKSQYSSGHIWKVPPLLFISHDLRETFPDSPVWLTVLAVFRPHSFPFVFLPSFLPLFFLKTESHYIVLVGLELSIWTRLALISWQAACLCLPNDGIKGMYHHHAWLLPFP